MKRLKQSYICRERFVINVRLSVSKKLFMTKTKPYALSLVWLSKFSFSSQSISSLDDETFGQTNLILKC